MESDYSKKTVVELKSLLKSRNLTVGGKKADLIARLEDFDNVKQEIKNIKPSKSVNNNTKSTKEPKIDSKNRKSIEGEQDNVITTQKPPTKKLQRTKAKRLLVPVEPVQSEPVPVEDIPVKAPPEFILPVSLNLPNVLIISSERFRKGLSADEIKNIAEQSFGYGQDILFVTLKKVYDYSTKDNENLTNGLLDYLDSIKNKYRETAFRFDNIAIKTKFRYFPYKQSLDFISKVTDAPAGTAGPSELFSFDVTLLDENKTYNVYYSLYKLVQ